MHNTKSSQSPPVLGVTSPSDCAGKKRKTTFEDESYSGRCGSMVECHRSIPAVDRCIYSHADLEFDDGEFVDTFEEQSEEIRNKWDLLPDGT